MIELLKNKCTFIFSIYELLLLQPITIELPIKFVKLSQINMMIEASRLKEGNLILNLFVCSILSGKKMNVIWNQ